MFGLGLVRLTPRYGCSVHSNLSFVHVARTCADRETLGYPCGSLGRGEKEGGTRGSEETPAAMSCLPPSLHAQGPIRAVVLALMMSLSIFMAVLACALPAGGNWWPMLAMAANLIAVISWGMFQPGIGCVVNNSAAFMDGNAGMCGPPVFELWGKWLTAFFAASSFAAAIILWRTRMITEDWAFALTMASVTFIYLTTWYAVATSGPPGGRGVNAPLFG